MLAKPSIIEIAALASSGDNIIAILNPSGWDSLGLPVSAALDPFHQLGFTHAPLPADFARGQIVVTNHSLQRPRRDMQHTRRLRQRQRSNLAKIPIRISGSLRQDPFRNADANPG